MNSAKTRLAPGSTLLLAYGSPIALGDAQASSAPRRWVHVATEGLYAGYRGGKEPFQFTRATFDSIIANFKAHPQFLAGADGAGERAVVPWDYEHASERMFSVPGVATHGVPATGWAYDLELRQSSDGKAQLWALSEYVGEAAQQVAAGEYRFSSVAVSPNYVNPVSGKDQGPTLTSIALTNKPFLQGLEPIAATLEQYGKASTPLEVLVGLREIFRLPTDGDPDKEAIVGQLQLLGELIASGAIPEYLEVEHVLERISSLLGLPLLSAPQAIIESAIAAASADTTPGETSSAPAQTTNNGVTTMAFSPQNLAKLALLLRSKETGEEAILLAAEKAAASQDVATNAIDQLRSIIGGEDFGAMLSNATKLATDAAKLAPALEQLAQLQNALKGVADTEAETEAEQIAASMAAGNPSLKAKIKAPILMLRKSAIKADGTTDEAILASFRKDYADHLRPDPQRQLLTSTLVAGRNGAQYGGAPTMGAQILASAGATAVDPQAATIAAINAQPGRNEIEKANAYLCSVDPSHKSLPLLRQIPLASQFLASITAAR